MAGTGCASKESPTTTEATTHEVEDFLGTTTIPAHPERIVADSASMFANLVALGVDPVAVAVPVGISTDYFWSGDAPPSVIAEDGWSIDVEKALTHRPDLILAVGDTWNEENLERYRKAVPTLAFSEGWKNTEHIKERFLVLGSDLGRDDEAAKAVADFDAKVADAKVAVEPHLAEIGKAGVVRFGVDNWIGVRKNELPSAIFAALGIAEPTWPKASDSGYVELSMETLGILDRADTLFVTVDDEIDVADVAAFDSPLWKLLEPVQAGKAHVVSAWNGWDLLQLGRIVDDIVAAVAP